MPKLSVLLRKESVYSNRRHRNELSTKFYTYTADLISIMFRYQLIRVARNWSKCGEGILAGLGDWRRFIQCAARVKLSIQQNDRLSIGINCENACSRHYYIETPKYMEWFDPDFVGIVTILYLSIAWKM
uniref:Uncharacterized protein n=1 Tax=Ditylenchus dipsaci TaxID=166011 RepID=A0A915DT10_9BILA